MKFSLVHNIIKTYFEFFIISWFIFLLDVDYFALIGHDKTERMYQ